jgi:hypothetical protein
MIAPEATVAVSQATAAALTTVGRTPRHLQRVADYNVVAPEDLGGNWFKCLFKRIYIIYNTFYNWDYDLY